MCRQLPATIALIAFAALVALGGPERPRGGEDFTVYCASGSARLATGRTGWPDDTPLAPVLAEEVDARRHRDEEDREKSK